MQKLFHRLKAFGVSEVAMLNIASWVLPYYRLFISRKGHEKFVIFMEGRSGSTLLVDLLNSHPDIKCESEIFTRRIRRPIHLIKGLYAYHFFKGAKAWGFKVKYAQLERLSISPKVFVDELIDDGFKIICLTRKNSAETALSRLVGWKRETGYHNQTHDSENLEKVTIEPERFRAAITYTEAERHDLLRLVYDVPHISLEYEKDLQREELYSATGEKLLTLLGLAQEKLSTSYKKVSTDQISDRITNYVEIEEILNEYSV